MPILSIASDLTEVQPSFSQSINPYTTEGFGLDFLLLQVEFYLYLNAFSSIKRRTYASLLLHPSSNVNTSTEYIGDIIYICRKKLYSAPGQTVNLMFMYREIISKPVCLRQAAAPRSLRSIADRGT